MRKYNYPRVYIDSHSGLHIGLQIELDKHQSNYICNVMRRQVTDKLRVFDNVSGEFIAEIIAADKRSAIIVLLEQTCKFSVPPHLALIYSSLKNTKDEFIIQKACELGATEIIQSRFERTVVKVKDEDKVVERLQKISVEACEQCERIDLPNIRISKKLGDLINELQDYQIIVADETGEGYSASSLLVDNKLCKDNSSGKYAVIVGPEGGFSDSELKILSNHTNKISIGLGQRILKAETAIVAILAITQMCLGRMADMPEFRS